MVQRHLFIGDKSPADAVEISGRGVREIDTPAFFARLDQASWDDIHLFRTVADATSLRRASQSSGLAINTIRDRLARLEKALETKLFARTRAGLRLTPDGHAMLGVSSELKSLGKRLGSGSHSSLKRQGQISFCVSEGIGAFWLTPRLQQLRQLIPGTRIALHNSLDQTRIHSSPHDFRIGFSRPTDPDLIITKLATVHFMLYASDEYLRLHGTPQSFDEAEGHCYIDQDTPGLNYSTVSLFLNSDVLDSLVAYSVNSSFSLYWAVVNGQGIAALPTYVRAISRRVRPLDLPVRMRFTLWLSYDMSIREFAPARKAVAWLRSCFDVQKHPWFRDDFVHPELFEAQLQDCCVIPLHDYGLDAYRDE